MDFATARTNMVKSQLVPNGINDDTILGSFNQVAREQFINDQFRDFSYSDYPIPVAEGKRRQLKPLQMAWMIQALKVTAGDRVLVIGAGTGYEAAVLEKMGAEVHALENDAALIENGKKATDGLNITWHSGKLDEGVADVAPFDAILFCGAVGQVPAKAVGQMAKTGRLMVITGEKDAPVMSAVRMEGVSGADHPESMFETVADFLPGLEPPERFVL
ncbi:MAG: protein-L-isoaspartate O-methyltransferase [Magnetococcales bacterium]|nr:protein-L-isoaspartate O-methyltransferase [Magnetococcales bacterium]